MEGRGLKKQDRGCQGLAPVSGAKCFQGKKAAVMARHSYAAVSAHVAATSKNSYNCRLFALEALSPSKRRQTLTTPGLFLDTLSLLVTVPALGFFRRSVCFFL